MAKIFYTDRDIEDLAKQGIDSIELSDDIVLTDLAVDKARRVGISLVKSRDKNAPGQSSSSEEKRTRPMKPALSDDLETRVYKAVKARLGDQVDDALLRTIIHRVLQNVGKH